MWALSLLTPVVPVPTIVRVVAALAIASVGVIIGLAGAIRFRHAKTTVNPMKPQMTSSLVTGGIYRYTRNPMYLGLLFVVVAWAVFLSSPWSLSGPVAFVLYIGWFQIIPEERVLSGLFGAAYTAYQLQVRRWL